MPDLTGKLIFDLLKHFLSDISVIGQEFYSDKINMYQEELRFLGVGFGYDDVQRLISIRFKSLAASALRKGLAFSLLMLIGFLMQWNGVNEQWLQAMKEGKWLKTHQGYNAPEGSVLLLSAIDGDSCLKITKLRIVDKAFYGSKICSFSSELGLLEVIVDSSEIYKLIAQKASFPAIVPSMSSGCGLLILRCIK